MVNSYLILHTLKNKSDMRLRKIFMKKCSIFYNVLLVIIFKFIDDKIFQFIIRQIQCKYNRLI